jgi:hypothetical protein
MSRQLVASVQLSRSNVPGPFSIELDRMPYPYDGTKTIHLYSGEVEWQFPRRQVSFGGLMFNVDETTFDGKPAQENTDLKCICIPSSFTSFCENCFENCEALRTVVFEYDSRLSTIGHSAFCCCSSLLSICIPCRVVTLDVNTFIHCRSLTFVTFESFSKLSSIGPSAFHRCPLASICLPSEVQQIGPSSLTSVIRQNVSIVAANRHLKLEGAFVMDFEGISIQTYFGRDRKLRIPKKVETLSPRSFEGLTGLSSITFESGSRLSCFGWSAFSGSSLSSICIPSSLKELGHNCFNHCSSLSSVKFESPSQLSLISDTAFCACSALPSICIPSSVTELQLCCFVSCWLLSNVTFESGSKLSSIRSSAFCYCDRLASIEIPSSVETLRSGCFDGCKSLSTITFESGSKLLLVERDAFVDCPALSSIWIPSSLQTILAQYQGILKIRPDEQSG